MCFQALEHRVIAAVGDMIAAGYARQLSKARAAFTLAVCHMLCACCMLHAAGISCQAVAGDAECDISLAAVHEGAP